MENNLVITDVYEILDNYEYQGFVLKYEKIVSKFTIRHDLCFYVGCKKIIVDSVSYPGKRLKDVNDIIDSLLELFEMKVKNISDVGLINIYKEMDKIQAQAYLESLYKKGNFFGKLKDIYEYFENPIFSEHKNLTREILSHLDTIESHEQFILKNETLVKYVERFIAHFRVILVENESLFDDESYYVRTFLKNILKISEEFRYTVERFKFNYDL